MKFQTELTKPDVFKTTIYNIQSRRFFRNEEDCFTRAQRMSDQITNGLTLTCSGRTNNDEIFPLVGSCDRRHLR